MVTMVTTNPWIEISLQTKGTRCTHCYVKSCDLCIETESVTLLKMKNCEQKIKTPIKMNQARSLCLLKIDSLNKIHAFT